MTDRYVGPGGNDGSNGLTWANRKLTLNGVEDTPVVAGDTVYVGPGVYREMLTMDIDGTSGAVITYIGDVTGENTDQVGGIVRITGSDNDTTSARTQCITDGFSTDNYRTFRGFMLDMASDEQIRLGSQSVGFIVEDTYFGELSDTGGYGIRIEGATQSGHIIRRCVFTGAGIDGGHVRFNHGATVDNTGHLIENCLFIGRAQSFGVQIIRIGGITVKNNTFWSMLRAVRVETALAGGQTTTVNNNIFYGNRFGLVATVTGEITEDYNSFFTNETDRTNVATGGNSVTYPPIWTPPLFNDGIQMPWWAAHFSEWSQLARIAGTGESTDDLFGVVRPTVSAKKSWGPIQLREAEREIGTVRAGSAALTLADAGDHQIYVPVTATSTTFSVYARYESEYAGTLPRLIVRQPGQADQVDTMVAAADTWEQLSLTFAPNADPPYVVVIFRSLNTGVTGEYDTYWDDLDVS